MVSPVLYASNKATCPTAVLCCICLLLLLWGVAGWNTTSGPARFRGRPSPTAPSADAVLLVASQTARARSPSATSGAAGANPFPPRPQRARLRSAAVATSLTREGRRWESSPVSRAPHGEAARRRGRCLSVPLLRAWRSPSPSVAARRSARNTQGVRGSASLPRFSGRTADSFRASPPPPQHAGQADEKAHGRRPEIPTTEPLACAGTPSPNPCPPQDKNESSSPPRAQGWVPAPRTQGLPL